MSSSSAQKLKPSHIIPILPPPLAEIDIKNALKAGERIELVLHDGTTLSGALQKFQRDEKSISVAVDGGATQDIAFARFRYFQLPQPRAWAPDQLAPEKAAQPANQGSRILQYRIELKDGSTLFPATALKSFGTGQRKVTVGLIGLTLQGTASLAPPDAVKEVTFANEADTANALVPQLKAQGADAIVILIHQGGRTSGTPDPNGCEGLNSAILPILDRLDPRIDVVISGHTHWAYVCDYGRINPAKPFLLTSAGLWGEMVTDIALEIDPASHRVVAKRARNVIVQSKPYDSPQTRYADVDLYPRFAARSDVAAYVARYVEAAKDFALRKIGMLGAPAPKPQGVLQNTGGRLGNLVADAQLAATPGAQIALTNPFGLRRSLQPAADGSVTFGDIYAVQPFNNDLMTLSYTGAEIKAALEQGFDSDGPEQILAPSAGFTYRYDRSHPVGARITAMTLNGKPIDPAKAYRVTLNNFLANGGDTFSAFTVGRNRTVGMTDIAALELWLKALPPRVPPAETRAIDARPDLNPVRSTAPPGTRYR